MLQELDVYYQLFNTHRKKGSRDIDFPLTAIE